MDCRKSDELQRLYERTGRAALLKVRRIVGRLDLAEEIVQAAFLKLWEAGLSFSSERAAYAWIYRVCHNAAVDHLRSWALSRQSLVEVEAVAVNAGFTDGYEARDALLRGLARLDEREAQIFAYRAVDGMTQEEIAEVLGVSRKTVVRACAAIDAKLGEES